MDEKENEIIEGGEEKVEEPSYISKEEPTVSDEPEVIYAFKWDYSEQFEKDKRAVNESKRSKRGAVVYGLIMLTVFVLAFAILAVSISFDNLGQGNMVANQELTVSQIVSVGLPSSVSIIIVTENGDYGSGSGFVVNDFGYVVTNYHVVENCYQIVVIDSTGKQFYADLIGYDAALDVAVLYAEGMTAKAALLSDSSQIKLGETVVAIGSPSGSGLSLSVSNGIVSATDRPTNFSTAALIQTNAPINPGNSGGPLFDSKGAVVGIVISKLTYTLNSEGEKVPLDGIGYAIPINAAKGYINAWVEQDLQKAMLGISAVPVVEGETYFFEGSTGKIYYYEENNGVKYKVDGSGEKVVLSEIELEDSSNEVISAGATGIYVINVTKGLGAYGILQKGDIVTGLGGIRIENVGDAREIFLQYSSGDVVSVEYYRNGQVISADMTLKTKGEMLAADRKG